MPAACLLEPSRSLKVFDRRSRVKEGQIHMAKARAIVKRRKAVRNIKKITKTMQMIATAKFQKSLKRAVGTKPYTLKVRELVRELAASVGDVDHPLLRRPDDETRTNRIALIVLTSNRGLAGTYKPEVMTLLPLAGVEEAADRSAKQVAEGEAQAKAGALDMKRSGADVTAAANGYNVQTMYDFSPEPRVLLDELLPLTVKSALFQAFLDATTSEHVARMVAMKSATDNADKMAKSLTMKYNRARQSQITTELSEIMGGVEAMKG